MARDRGAVCRICRREGEKLFLKGQRCFTDKCSYQKRQTIPGQHGQMRIKLKDYGMQLREKQKVKRTYGMLERQFRKFFKEAERMRGVTGESMLILLERRLDNVIYRAGFAVSRRQARQLVLHGHFLVNDRKVSIPSFLIKSGDVIRINEKSKELQPVKYAVGLGAELPTWMDIDKEKLRCVIKNLPVRDDIKLPIKEQLIVELYSK